MGVFALEKISLIKRRPIFWYIQIGGWGVIMAISFYFSLSFVSVLCGVVAGYVNIEWLFQTFLLKLSFIFSMLKYMIFFLILYVLIKNYDLDGISFLVGMTSLVCCLIGLGAEAIRYDSL